MQIQSEFDLMLLVYLRPLPLVTPLTIPLVAPFVTVMLLTRIIGTGVLKYEVKYTACSFKIS